MLLQFGKGRRPLLVDFSLNVAPAFLTRSCVVVSDDPALINKLTFQKLINRPPMFGPTTFINLSVQHIFSLYINLFRIHYGNNNVSGCSEYINFLRQVPRLFPEFMLSTSHPQPSLYSLAYPR